MLREAIEKELEKERKAIAEALKGTGYELEEGRGNMSYYFLDGECKINFSIIKKIIADKDQGGGE